MTRRCRWGCQLARDPWVCRHATMPTARSRSPVSVRIAAVTVRAATRAISPSRELESDAIEEGADRFADQWDVAGAVRVAGSWHRILFRLASAIGPCQYVLLYQNVRSGPRPLPNARNGT